VGGNEVVRILRELVLRQAPDQLVDRGRAHDKEEHATHDFQNAVETLEGDADLKGPVEQVCRFEAAHASMFGEDPGLTYPVNARLPAVKPIGGFGR